MTSSPDVIVIGAGVAGLAAATALSAAGARVLVLEARGTLGGRTSSFVDRGTGQVIDNGQHVVLGCYRETFAYLDRIEARDGIDLQSSLEVPIVDERGILSTLRCPAWPSPLHLVGGVLAWEALGWTDRLSVARLLPALVQARRLAASAGRAPRRLHTQSVAAWLRERGQTARLCQLLWEPLALAALNQPIATAAAAPFVRVLGGVFGPNPRDAAIGLPTRPLDAVFAAPARAYLEARGSEVRLHAPARLALEGTSIRGAVVRGSLLRADHVVAAVPWTGWRNLVSETDADAAGLDGLKATAGEIRSSPIVTVNLWFEREVLPTRLLGLPGRVFQWVFQKRSSGSEHASRTAVHLSCVSSGADDTVSTADEILVEQAWRELREALPRTGSGPAHTLVVRARQATFSLAPGEPARPPVGSAIDRLWLAGDWTDTGLPATIEGAVQSGHAAARAILEPAGLKTGRYGRADSSL